eukprot:6199028-Pleurochrysis_carterae.AAC.1
MTLCACRTYRSGLHCGFAAFEPRCERVGVGVVCLSARPAAPARGQARAAGMRGARAAAKLLRLAWRRSIDREETLRSAWVWLEGESVPPCRAALFH